MGGLQSSPPVVNCTTVIHHEYEQYINGLVLGNDAGLEHIGALSDHLQRPIIVYHGLTRFICGEIYLKINAQPIQIRHYPPDEHNSRGHYVPLGKSSNWSCVENRENNILFHAVAYHTIFSANQLRNSTIEKMRQNPGRYMELYVRAYNGDRTLLLGGGNPRRYGLSKEVEDARQSIFPNYTREWPTESDRVGQYNAAYHHIINRFHYSWAFFRVFGDYLRAEYVMDIFVRGGVFYKDRKSGQGGGVHAAHIARARIKEAFESAHSRAYRIVASLCAITENMNNSNVFHTFDANIDFFSEYLLENPELDFDNYQTNYLEFVREVSLGVFNECQVIREAATAVDRDWSSIVGNARRNIERIVAKMKRLVETPQFSDL